MNCYIYYKLTTSCNDSRSAWMPYEKALAMYEQIKADPKCEYVQLYARCPDYDEDYPGEIFVKCEFYRD